MHQAPEIRRHQESNKTRARQPEGHDGRDPGTELAQKQTSISNTVMKRMGLHLGTPEDHPGMLTDMSERYLHLLISS